VADVYRWGFTNTCGDFIDTGGFLNTVGNLQIQVTYKCWWFINTATSPCCGAAHSLSEDTPSRRVLMFSREAWGLKDFENFECCAIAHYSVRQYRK